MERYSVRAAGIRDRCVLERLVDDLDRVIGRLLHVTCRVLHPVDLNVEVLPILVGAGQIDAYGGGSNHDVDELGILPAVE